jgi:hypothetical protein
MRYFFNPLLSLAILGNTNKKKWRLFLSVTGLTLSLKIRKYLKAVFHHQADLVGNGVGIILFL